MNAIPFRKIFASACIMALFSTSVLAQFVWVDEKNVTHYSDLPPPAAISSSRTLTLSAGHQTEQVNKNQSATLAEQESTYQKRRTEQQRQKQAAEQESKHKTSQDTNCALARANQRLLDSGVRIAQLDAHGASIPMNTQQRTEQKRQNQEILDQCP